MITRGQVQNLIKDCLQGDIISGNFDVGFINGVNVIRVGTREDVKEMWSEIEKAKSNTMLWCDGLVDNERKSTTSSRKRKNAVSDDSDDESSTQKKKKDRDEKVQ